MYIFGSAGAGTTYQNNLDALEQWRIIPRMLRNATDRSLEVSSAYLLSASPRADPFASLDYPVWREAPLATAHRSRRSTRNHTQGWRARNCDRGSKGRCANGHVDRGHAFDRSCGRGQRERPSVVPAILVRVHLLSPGGNKVYNINVGQTATT